jgi:hypothetical protein
MTASPTALKSLLADLAEALRAAGVKPADVAVQLSLEDWLRIEEALCCDGVEFAYDKASGRLSGLAYAGIRFLLPQRDAVDHVT